MLLQEVGVVVLVLLGFAPPSTFFAASSSKVIEIISDVLFLLEVNGINDETDVSVVSLDEQLEDWTDKEISDFSSLIGGSYAPDALEPLNGVLTIPLTNDASVNLHMSKSAKGPTELLTGCFNGFKGCKSRGIKLCGPLAAAGMIAAWTSKCLPNYQREKYVAWTSSHSEQLLFFTLLHSPKSKRRFHSLVPQVENIVVRVDYNILRLIFSGIIKPIQTLSQFLGPKRPSSSAAATAATSPSSTSSLAIGFDEDSDGGATLHFPHHFANVFGVSTESMQLSFDARGNSVPTILLLMQRHLYAQGGLQAWFRELPTRVLDPFSPEQVMQSQSEEECAQLVRLLPPTEVALLDWAINLMADVTQMENLNNMNARNIAMVFAPNMTQFSSAGEHNNRNLGIAVNGELVGLLGGVLYPLDLDLSSS
ncbi:hypothetical protein JHK85_043601 [Glycine max]|nr:hypothetical protein JHK85_043601 [Glycine max]